MKHQFKTLTRAFFAAIIVMSAVTSCKKDDEPDPIKEGIERSELILTEVTGTAIEAHGDHFHGLTDLTEGTPIVIKFNENGTATANGHLHLEADAVYKIQLKAWDYTGKEVQNDYIASKAVADSYKAFLGGGNFALNKDSEHESGAIFQPREVNYGDGTAVSGATQTTGILSYFTIGHDNEGATKEVSYILRKLDAGVKATITRSDWNDNDYAAKFAGQDVLKLKFEIHAEEGHSH